jgi:glutamyl-Q tRNA(Asp) synthetase
VSTTRFAPSPTGRLHLGHAFSAVLGHSLARGAGGKFRLRIEDLDQSRSRSEFIAGIYEDLQWLGLDWDEPVLVQSQRNIAYTDALDRLKARGLVYACFCTRADIAAALEAPHGPSGTRYPGTCRALSDDPDRRMSTPHCWRLDSAKAVEGAGCASWAEQDGSRFTTAAADFDDVILARKDAPASYHLACVVDDAATGVGLVVRAADLRTSTPIQRLLQTLLGLPEPCYIHHPLVAHSDGRRLAKRDRAPTLMTMREQGVDGGSLGRDLEQGRLPLGFTLIEA